jgi:serine/threonine protein kinase
VADLREQLQSGLAERYTLQRELGRGGMATVFLAHDLRHKRSVALKVLHPELAQTLGSARFQREIETAARLQHPHILTVLDSGESAGQLWFTMPYVEGESLRDRLRGEAELPVDDTLRITTDAARALDYAHQHGVIHRDIKPENLLLTKDGSTLVADFGIARALSESGEQLTQTGLSVGTPTYMSPEQAAGDRNVDARTDVYALGTVLYEMLVGEPPKLRWDKDFHSGPRLPARPHRPSLLATSGLTHILSYSFICPSGSMILIELDTGNEELFKSSEELAAAIRRGAIGPNARIYHRVAARWLPITVYPEFRKAAAERRYQPLPPLKRKHWTFLATDAQEDQLAPDSSLQAASSPGSPSQVSEQSARPKWRRAIGNAIRRLRFPKTN